MYCRDYMKATPVTIAQDAPMREAIALTIRHQQQHLLVVDDAGRFVGELDIHQLAKILVPSTVGPHFALMSEVSPEESAAETAEEVEARLDPYLSRPVKDFVNDDVPIVTADMPIGNVLMMLRGGAERMPVVEGPDQKLVGSISMLTILQRFHSE